MDFVHPELFRRHAERYSGSYKVKSFTCWDQFLCMAFGQLTYRESLRDIETCLRSRQDQLYHLGIRGRVSHTTLADANQNHDWRIYHDLAQALIKRARLLYGKENLGMELEQTVYALDSTTIDLYLKLFPWARFRRAKAAVKLFCKALLVVMETAAELNAAPPRTARNRRRKPALSTRRRK